MSDRGISRRTFMAATGAAVLAGPAAAGLSCSAFTGPPPFGLQRCRVGLEGIEVLGAGQLCPHWCWAACIQSVFATAGYIIADQRRIVAALFGRADLCASATGSQIVATVSRAWQADDGRWFRARAQPLLDLSLGLWNPRVVQAVAWDLANGFPLINGALGHATLLTGMTYLTDHAGAQRGIEDITVRDPLVPLGQPALQRALSVAEAQGTFFVGQVRVYA
ncbi:MAG TPA: hypothetical protein PKD10_09485 [Paracoccaceae bacterium]|nr:hypothetical protein [Paracoccaceae bacterium]